MQRMSKTNDKAIRAMREFLEAVGIDLQQQGMEKTPERVAKMYQFLFNGIDADTAEIWGETFNAGSEGIVAVRHLPFYSMCEHHLVPFFGEVNIAYLPAAGKVAGFSKFSRLIELLSHRPQLQERLSFHQDCQDWLERHGQRYLAIGGDWQQREAQALAQVERWLKLPSER